MTPWQRYQDDLKRDDFQPDPAQEQAVRMLQAVYEALVAREQSTGNAGWGRWLPKKRAALTPVQGLYFWGGVGRGKTYLVDMFYECVPFEAKLRMHFHRFMQRVHRDLKTHKGKKNPLTLVAEGIAGEARVLCFDEFFVSDITDAMLLAGLLEGLFARGVTLITTSNIVPDELYRNGLQRARFLPAIDLVKQHTQVVNVDGGTDYRLRALEQAEIYHYPLDAAATESLQHSFDQLSVEPGQRDVPLEIEGRFVQTLQAGDGVVWFDYPVICNVPRGQADYIELARCYHTVLVSNVPQMGLANDDLARRFINLVDEFYDRNVKLILAAEVPLTELYAEGRLQFEFQRTISRLQEMQSHEYLAREHLP